MPYSWFPSDPSRVRVAISNNENDKVKEMWPKKYFLFTYWLHTSQLTFWLPIHTHIKYMFIRIVYKLIYEGFGQYFSCEILRISAGKPRTPSGKKRPGYMALMIKILHNASPSLPLTQIWQVWMLQSQSWIWWVLSELEDLWHPALLAPLYHPPANRCQHHK